MVLTRGYAFAATLRSHSAELNMIAALLLNVMLGSSSWAQTTPGHGGTNGPDLTLEAIEPAGEPVRVGLAGDDPADIAPYLLASGAGDARLSPDGESVALSWSVTGAPQLWVVAAVGGAPRQLTFGNGITFSAGCPIARV